MRGPEQRLHDYRLAPLLYHRIARFIPYRILRHLFRAGRLIARDVVTDADPFRIIYIDPLAIESSILETAPNRPQWGLVEGGNWDRELEPFSERAVPRAIKAHYNRGVDWENTALFGHFLDQLERFGNAWGYTSADQFPARCAEVHRLYTSIESHGYLTQSTIASWKEWQTIPRLDEINIDIGRNGEFLWRAYGQHRLAIARYLGIDRVPVLIQRRHRDWQRLRNEVRSGNEISSDVGLDHPDLRNIVGE